MQIQENTPMFLYAFCLRVQLYAWNNASMKKDLQDTSKLYGLVSVESDTLFFLAR